MRIRGWLAAGLLVVLSSPLAAQQFFNVGEEVQGKINVQINATLNDGIGDYRPVNDLVLTIFRSAVDSVQLRTDETGILKTALPPGTYRISSASPVTWHGRDYRWNIPLVVQRRLGIVNLTAENAFISGVAARSAPMRVPVEPTSSTRYDQPYGFPYEHKSGTTGVLLSVLVTGGGQMYAGRMGKGLGLLATNLIGSALYVSSIVEYDSYAYSSSYDARLGIGIGLMLGSYIYSIATANGDVTDFNRAHYPYADLQPTIERRDGRTAIGLAMRF